MNCGFYWSCSRFSDSFSNEEIIGLPRAAWQLWYAICNATLVWVLQAAEFGMVFAGDISDVMSDGEEQWRFEACEHKHTTSRFRIHLAKAELAVPFFCTDVYYIVYKLT